MKNNKLTLNIARIISTAFVPPTFTVLLFIYFSFLIEPDLSNQIFIIINSLIFGLLLPIIVFVKLRKDYKITDIDASIKEERNTPYLLNSLFCISAIPPLLILKVDIFFILLWAILFISTIILYFINRYWKISAHLIAACIALGALQFVDGNINFYLFLSIIIIGWARIRLNVHNLTQIIAGGILGFAVSYFGFSLIYNLII